MLCPFKEQHYSVTYRAERWGFSTKTIREWFIHETGAGILRQVNSGRRSKRDYITLIISHTAAARVYARRIKEQLSTEGKGNGNT